MLFFELLALDNIANPDPVDASISKQFDLIEQQVLQLSEQGALTTESGQLLAIQADTICVHGDGAHAVEAVQRIRQVVDGASAL